MSIDYQMWLTFDGEREKLQIPKLPETFDIRDGSNNSNVNVAGLGEVTIIGDRPALEFSFSSFFPFNSETSPQILKSKITEWKNSKQPVHFILTSFSVDLFCTIESFTTSENGGDVGTIYYSLTLKEYREINVRTVIIAQNTGTAIVKPDTKRIDNRTIPPTYTTVFGDTTFDIAKKIYGDSNRYTELYRLNMKTIDKVNPKGNVGVLPPGIVLKLMPK